MRLKFLLVTAVFLSFPPGVCAENAQANAAGKESTQQIDGFFLAGYGEKGKKTWDISGKTADILDETVKMDNITGNLYGDKEDIRLTANAGDFNKKDGKVHLEDNVVITTTSGAKLVTDSMDWDRKNRLVSTPDIVSITRDNMTTVGKGAVGEPSLKKVTLKEDVKVDILPSAKDKNPNKIVINCDGPLEVDYDKNIATFNNNVRVETKDNIMESDIMDVYFLPAGKKDAKETKASGDPTGFGMAGASIERIVARGNVKITRGENISFSQEAVYRAADRKIILNGKPQLVIYSQEDLGASFGNQGAN